ncbi:MAG: SDR family NAD(P)-dependent oxidoreductase [Bacteroidota bacterium]
MRLSNNLKTRLLREYGPWALVTGSSSGIGREIAKRLAESGINLVLTGRQGIQLEGLSALLEAEYGIKTRTAVADLSSMSEIYELIDATNDLDIGLFVASAGYGTSGLFFQNEAAEEIRLLQVNCLALAMLTHYFSRSFAERGKGGIILLSSIVGFQGVPNAANYAASKAYVQSLGEGLYHELKPYGVSVLTAAPGPVKSGFAKRADMEMGNAQNPEMIGIPILKALGKSPTVFPGRLTKTLLFGLRTVPRWGKIRIMKSVMAGMTKHQKLLRT